LTETDSKLEQSSKGHVFLQVLTHRLASFQTTSNYLSWIIWFITALIAVIFGVMVNFDLFSPGVDNFIQGYGIVIFILMISIPPLGIFALAMSLVVMPFLALFVLMPIQLRSAIKRGFFRELQAESASSREIAGDARFWVISKTVKFVVPGFLILAMILIAREFSDYPFRTPTFHYDYFILDHLQYLVLVISGWFLLLNLVMLAAFYTRAPELSRKIFKTGIIYVLIAAWVASSLNFFNHLTPEWQVEVDYRVYANHWRRIDIWPLLRRHQYSQNPVIIDRLLEGKSE